MKVTKHFSLRVVCYCAGAVLCAVLVVVSLSALSSRAPEKYAQDAIEQCAKTPDRAACYETTIPALYPKLSVPELFQVIRTVRSQDPSYQFCHVLAHKLGERLVAEDPDRWVDFIPLNPTDGFCSNGFVHGVVGGRFRSEVLDDKTLQQLIPDFSRACEPRGSYRPSDLDRAICYHGMGHLYDFITDAVIPKALDLCSRTVPQDHRRMCIEGVFMQIYQPLEPDDFALIQRMPVRPATSTVRSFCARYSDPLYEGACLRESWSFFYKEIRDGTGVTAFCSGQPNAVEEDKCYDSMSSIVGRLSLDNEDTALTACGHFLNARQLKCYTASAQAILEENRNDAVRAVDFCSKTPAQFSSACSKGLLEHADFLFGANGDQYRAFCEALPSSLRSECMRGYEYRNNSR